MKIEKSNRDNVDAEYLAAPKTWNAKSLARFMIVLGPTSSVFDMCVFSLNWYVHRLSYLLFSYVPKRRLALPNRYRYGIRTEDSPNVPRAQTAWFIEGAMTQVRFSPSPRNKGSH